MSTGGKKNSDGYVKVALSVMGVFFFFFCPQLTSERFSKLLLPLKISSQYFRSINFIFFFFFSMVRLQGGTRNANLLQVGNNKEKKNYPSLLIRGL